MKKTIIISGIILGIVIIGFLVFVPQNKLGNIPLGTAFTNSSSTVNSVASLVMDEKSGAQVRTISNIGDVVVYLSFNNATSSGFTATTGYVLRASNTLEMNEAKGNLWTGKIWGVTSAGTSTLSMSQL